MRRSVAVVCAGIAALVIAGRAGVSAERATPADPVKSLAVLVDTSEAIQPYVNHIRAALRSFVAQMQPTHQIAIVEFGERPTVLTDYTSDPARLKKGVDRVFARSGTGAYVLDAIVETSKGLKSREGSNPAIVVITAEGPEFSDRYHEAVLDELQSTKATLHVFVLTAPRGQSLHSDGAREREFTLALGTARTGGTREYLLTSMALEPRLGELAARLK